jgi:hypothetical protein
VECSREPFPGRSSDITPTTRRRQPLFRRTIRHDLNFAPFRHFPNIPNNRQSPQSLASLPRVAEGGSGSVTTESQRAQRVGEYECGDGMSKASKAGSGREEERKPGNERNRILAGAVKVSIKLGERNRDRGGLLLFLDSFLPAFLILPFGPSGSCLSVLQRLRDVPHIPRLSVSSVTLW